MKNRKIFMLLFYIYLFLILSVTLNSSGVTNVGGYSYFQKVIRCSNLIPFYSISSIESVLVPFIMYMPFAILARGSYDCFNIKKHYIIFIFLLVTIFELFQVVTLKGYFDINDIILGCLGSFLVYYAIDLIKGFLENN